VASVRPSLRALEDFIEEAFEFGKQAFNARASSTALRLGLGWFRFAESHPLLLDDTVFCLGTTDVTPKEMALGCIYADYSGWHIHRGFSDMVQRPESQIMIDDYLARKGWCAAFNPERNTWDLFDRNIGFGLRLLPSEAHQAVWEPTAPLAHFCKWMAEAQGLTMVHAAAVAHGKVGALIVGPGGAGKSGTVLAAMAGGLSSVGDDYVLIDGSSVQATYCTVKQGQAGMDRLGLTAMVAPNWQNKFVFRPEDVIGLPIQRHAMCHAVLVPQIGADKTTVSRIDGAVAFKIITFSTLRQLGSGYGLVFQRCGDLIRSLPSFQLHLSSEPQEIAKALEQFFETLAC